MELGAFGFVSFASADVARDLRRADDRPSASLTGETISEMSTGVPSLCRRTVSISTGSPARMWRQHHVFLAPPVGRNDQRDRLADRLGCGVAEHPLGAAVPGHDDAVEVLADDRVVGRFDDGRESLRRAARLLERVDAARARPLSAA